MTCTEVRPAQRMAPPVPAAHAHIPTNRPASQATRRPRRSFPVALAALAALVFSTACAVQRDSGMTEVERGRYLVTISGCNDCHTPFKMGANGPEPDLSRLLSGHPEGQPMPPPPALPMPWMWVGGATNTSFSGPWGITYAPNLTPDEETGIGAWDFALFKASIRNGKIHGVGRPVLPPMPWQAYAQMTDEDLQAVFAYLKSIPAIKNAPPEYAPPAAPSENSEAH